MFGQPVVRTALLASAYVVAALFGRLTLLNGESLALVWPPAGMAMVWVLLGPGRRRWSVLGVGLTAFVFNLVIGGSWSTASVFTASILAMVLVAVPILTRTCPHLWGCGGDEPLAHNRDLGFFVLGSTAGTLASAAIGSLGLWLIDAGSTGQLFLLWWGRNTCGVLLIVSVVLLTGHAWRVRSVRSVFGPATMWELAALLLSTVVLYALVFTQEEALPFALLTVTVWAALRFSTVIVAWQSALVGAAVLAYTLRGVGPFALVDDPQIGALLAQLFVALVTVIGLAVAVGRDERAALAEELAGARHAAEAQATLLRTVMDAMGDGLTVLESPGTVVMQNPASLRLFGLRRQTSIDDVAPLVTLPDGSPLDPDDRPSVRALRGENVPGRELLVHRPDGSRVMLRVSGTYLKALDGEASRAVMVSHDVTSEVERREELEAFARVVAHDLRNPLAGIEGWVLMIRSKERAGALTPELLTTFTERLNTSVGRLHDLIDGLLERATTEDRTLSLARVDLDATLRKIVEGRGATGLVEWGDLPAVHADSLLTSQALDNLVTNAMKYVAPGVTPHVEITAEVEVPGWVTVRVADNGIGIPEGEEEAIFDEFHRIHDGTYAGTGLGLSIVRRAVSRHGGTISAYPNPAGRGTVFELTLPVAT